MVFVYMDRIQKRFLAQEDLSFYNVWKIKRINFFATITIVEHFNGISDSKICDLVLGQK